MTTSHLSIPSESPLNTGQAVVEIGDTTWNGLYRLAAVAALIAAIIFRRWLGSEAVILQSFGILNFVPVSESGTVADWFALLQSDRLIGLTMLNFFDLVNYALVGLIFLGLYAALVRIDKAAMTLAAALGLLGIAVYFASNQALAMLSLSDQYAAATTDAQRELYLAAGQAMLTMNSFLHGGSGLNIGFLLVNLAALIMSIVMLRGQVFNRATAYIGIVANGFGVGTLVTLILAPSLTFIPLSASAPFLLIWYILVARRLFQLASIR